MRLAGQKAAVVGGTGSFSLAIARAVLDAEGEVVIGSPSPDRLLKAVETLGTGATGAEIDVNDDASVSRFLAGAGDVHHIAMAVGGPVRARGLAPVEDVKAVFETRFWGQYRVARAAAEKLPSMRSVTFVSGATSKRPLYGALLGAVLNGAVDGLTRAMAVQLAPIRVNSVAPSVIDSNQLKMMPDEARKAFFGKVAAEVPAGRVGVPEDIAKAFLFLMDHGYMTGSTIFVDGGALLKA